MKTFTSLACMSLFGLTLALSAQADEQKTPPAQPGTASDAPAMSEIPKMKELGERMAVLMEKLTKETDPAERKRIMAEAICPQ